MNALASSFQPPEFISLFSDRHRWGIVAALARSDLRVHELAQLVDKPLNQVSYHLRRLRNAKLVRERRSDADARDVYYSLDLDRLHQLYCQTGESLHPGVVSQNAITPLAMETSSKPPARVLFLCTENAARSQMAEGILRHLSRGQVEVVSAGSHPTRVHPLAVRVLAEHGMDISRHRSKSLAEFRDQTFDYIITVCDRVREACPTFPEDPERIHWSFADPAAVEGSEGSRYLAFQATAKELMTMIRYLLIMIERKERDAAKAAPVGEQ